jgi:hypothetical protein
MGWSSGSRLFSDLIDSLKKHITDEDTRQSVYEDFIEAFEDADCDTLQECEGEDYAFDAALKELHPDWFEDEEDEE